MSPEAGWLLVDQIVPRLRAVIPRSVLCVGAEDHEELIQDATCMAARIMENGERKGKRVPHQSAAYSCTGRHINEKLAHDFYVSRALGCIN